MASEDWFLRLDPYNFDTQNEFYEFYKEKEKKNDKRTDNRSCGKSVTDIR